MKSTRLFFVLSMALASMAATQAQAQVSPGYYGYNNNIATDDISFGTGYVNGTPPLLVPSVSLADTKMSITVNKMTLPAFNAVGAQFAVEGLATMEVTKNSRAMYTSVNVKLKADDILAGGQSITSIESNTPPISMVSTNGSLTMVTYDDQLANSGGALTLSNLTLDATGQRILADVVSDNGQLPFVAQLPFFTLTDTVVVQPTMYYPTTGSTSANLALTAQGFNAIVAGLGLMNPGIEAMDKVAPSFGVMSLNVATVPEASTWTSMVLGMVAMAGVIGRARRRQSV